MRSVVSLMITLLCAVGIVTAQETTRGAGDGPGGAPSISVIQGAGHVSTFHRENVEGVAGIVTAVGLGNGFYMESPQPDDDQIFARGNLRPDRS